MYRNVCMITVRNFGNQYQWDLQYCIYVINLQLRHHLSQEFLSSLSTLPWIYRVRVISAIFSKHDLLITMVSATKFNVLIYCHREIYALSSPHMYIM